jgi:hypothetical protein
MGGQGSPVLQVGEVVDVDDGDRGLAVLGDRDRTMRVPGPGDQATNGRTALQFAAKLGSVGLGSVGLGSVGLGGGG